MKQEVAPFLLRLESSLVDLLKLKASRLGLSMNEFCKIVLSKELSTPAATPLFERLSKFLKETAKEDLVGVILFGSAARGTATNTSDIDLLLVLDSDAKVSRDLYDCWDNFASQSDEPEIKKYSPHFSALPTEPLRTEGIWLETALDGIVLWEMNLRVSRLLGEIRKAIADRKLIRKLSHGHPYWMLAGEEL